MLRAHSGFRGTHQHPFVLFTKRVVSEAIGLGRYGVLVDAPATEDGGDPFLVGYPTEAICNWRTTVIDSRPQLTEFCRITFQSAFGQSVFKYAINASSSFSCFSK